MASTETDTAPVVIVATTPQPQKVCIVDDYLEWSNLAYLTVSRVLPSSRSGGQSPPAYDEATARKNMGRKLQAYKRVDTAIGLVAKQRCNLRITDIEGLKKAQENRCTACNIEMLWCYTPHRHAAVLY